MGFRERLEALLGISAFAAEPANTPSLGDKDVHERLKQMGGHLSPLPTTRLRWYLADVETAQYAADSGDLSIAAQMVRASMGDGFLRGVLAARMAGVTKLPRNFTGDDEQVAALTLRDGARSVFDDMFPATELAQLATDGLLLGVGVAQLVPVPARGFPVMVRLDPEFLRYRWRENRWYYASIAGLLPITPGDGKWILHIEGGRVSPWQAGLWRAIVNAWLAKAHAGLHEANWEAKLANPARVAYAAVGANEGERRGFLKSLIAWGVNTVFELPPGWDVKILESNGRGHESFPATIDRSNVEYMICILGQLGTTTSAGAFASGDVHEQVRADLIGATAGAICHTVNTQGIPPWAVNRYGDKGLVRTATFEYDTESPQARKARADGLTSLSAAVKSANEALAAQGKRVDAEHEFRRFGVAVVDIAAAPVAADPVAPAPGDAPKLELVKDSAAEPVADPAVALAEAMTAHGVTRCEHGALNRCRLCGVERVRVLLPAEDGGEHAWGVEWKAITSAPSVAFEPSEEAAE